MPQSEEKRFQFHNFRSHLAVYSIFAILLFAVKCHVLTGLFMQQILENLISKVMKHLEASITRCCKKFRKNVTAWKTAVVIDQKFLFLVALETAVLLTPNLE